jgi:beta-xylosidase
MSHSILSFLAVISYILQSSCAPPPISGGLALSHRDRSHVGGGQGGISGAGSGGGQGEGQGGNPPTLMIPLMQDNFPDPAFIEVDGTFYAFATQSGGANVPIASSTNMTGMAIVKKPDGALEDAMPTLPSWTNQKDPGLWAPDVVQLADGSFVLYYSATSDKDESKHCIGAATSQSITGPFVPTDHELACPLKFGGAIDPAGFVDADREVYVVYKVDGNSLGGGGPCRNKDQAHDTPLMLQEVSATDGYTPIGHATPLLHLSPSDGPLIEAPSLVRSADGTYVLFFSSNCYNTRFYDTSYATSTNVVGPYTRSSTPLLVTGVNGLLSPGGTDVLADGSRIVFHADVNPSDASVRRMYTSRIRISGRTVSLA